MDSKHDFQLQVLYMGFGYTHIEYDVDVDNRGNVMAISGIKMWD